MIIIDVDELYQIKKDLENTIEIAEKINKKTETMRERFLALNLDEKTVNKIINVFIEEEQK